MNRPLATLSIGAIVLIMAFVAYFYYINMPNLILVSDFRSLRSYAPTMCEYEFANAEASGSAKVYFLNGSVRSTSLQSTQGSTEVVHIIYDADTYLKYIWTDSGNVKIKTRFTDVQFSENNVIQPEPNARCKRWLGSSEFFFTPPPVQFWDLTTQSQ